MFARRLLLLIALLPIAAYAQSPDDACPNGAAFKGAASIERNISDFKITISKRNDGCTFEVRDVRGQLVTSGSNRTVEALPEMYVLRIGSNDLVIETSSGGAHCCWTYFIATQVGTPHLAAKIENEERIDFLDYRGIELNDLVAHDGGFIDFEQMPYNVVPMPTVFIRFVRGKPTDVGSIFKSQYDQEIAQARARIRPDALQYFHSRNIYDDVEVASNVLRIVLAYLYSGREEQAWKELADMWPPADMARIKVEILKARAKGILRYTRQ